MANTFLLAQGKKMGKSLVEDDKLALARNFLRKADREAGHVILPMDLVVADGLDAMQRAPVVVPTRCPPTRWRSTSAPSAASFAENRKHARTLFWNGPMGVFEKPPFAEGTLAVAKAVAANELATPWSAAATARRPSTRPALPTRSRHVSTGGGAALEYIQGLTLPGIAALEESE